MGSMALNNMQEVGRSLVTKIKNSAPHWYLPVTAVAAGLIESRFMPLRLAVPEALATAFVVSAVAGTMAAIKEMKEMGVDFHDPSSVMVGQVALALNSEREYYYGIKPKGFRTEFKYIAAAGLVLGAAAWWHALPNESAATAMTSLATTPGFDATKPVAVNVDGFCYRIEPRDFDTPVNASSDFVTVKGDLTFQRTSFWSDKEIVRKQVLANDRDNVPFTYPAGRTTVQGPKREPINQIQCTP